MILCKVFNAQRQVCIYLCIYFFDLITILYKNVGKADSGNKCLEKQIDSAKKVVRLITGVQRKECHLKFLGMLHNGVVSIVM